MHNVQLARPEGLGFRAAAPRLLGCATLMRICLRKSPQLFGIFGPIANEDPFATMLGAESRAWMNTSSPCVRQFKRYSWRGFWIRTFDSSVHARP